MAFSIPFTKSPLGSSKLALCRNGFSLQSYVLLRFFIKSRSSSIYTRAAMEKSLYDFTVKVKVIVRFSSCVRFTWKCRFGNIDLWGFFGDQPKRIVEHCIKKRLQWNTCFACKICKESEYYEDMMRYLRKNLACSLWIQTEGGLRKRKPEKGNASPRRLTLDVSSICNGSDCMACCILCFGVLQKIMWKLNKSIAKELLPTQPVDFAIEPWWGVCLVNFTLEEFKRLSEEEMATMDKMLSERRRIEAPSTPATENSMPPPPSYEEVSGLFASEIYDGSTDNVDYFLGEVVNSFKAVTDVEFSLSIGDYVIVRKVSSSGWAEGECKGKAGWFPFNYVERRERVLATKACLDEHRLAHELRSIVAFLNYAYAIQAGLSP
ncbi:Rho guanine nucleotide exchange factor 6 [Morus notabilis]|uniref:Rho guanine nucleotide exchange factor 6 n=1 Tax=Morus notabilis TaxID=981085 RepID=W9QT06_9ROSA|nr:Rho guanine nucleotide exchange factor 6 [Morus notabilis]